MLYLQPARVGAQRRCTAAMMVLICVRCWRMGFQSICRVRWLCFQAASSAADVGPSGADTGGTRGLHCPTSLWVAPKSATPKICPEASKVELKNSATEYCWSCRPLCWDLGSGLRGDPNLGFLEYKARTPHICLVLLRRVGLRRDSHDFAS
jgi:hypothetical protein